MGSRTYLDGLNSAQLQAVQYGIGSGSAAPPALLIIAGAGTGKTNTLAHRVAHLMVNGADPLRIMLLTFTRRAAQEMTRRVERICTAAMPNGQFRAASKVSWAGTFHAIGSRLLRQHAESIGLDPAFTILDREDAADLMNLVRDDLGFSGLKSRFPRKATCLAIYSFAVNAEAPLSQVLPKAFPWCEEWEAELKSLFAAYVEAKQRQNVLDYDDLMLYWAQMMQVPELAAQVGERFDHVLVDEYQDTNSLQASILLGLKPDGAGLTVVGDDAQSIYSFRAATVRNILDFPGHFEPDAAVITLERNYRSTQTILAASNAVMDQATERFTKNLRSDRRSQERPHLITVSDETGQAGYVVERILANREAGLALKDQAVLFRTSHHSGPLEIELARRNIPFVKFGGLKFLEAAHIKDIISILRWTANQRDRVAGFRVLQLLPGIGPGYARKALDRLETDNFLSDALASFRPPSAAVEDWPELLELIRRLRRLDAGWPQQIELAVEWLKPHLERLYDSLPSRISDLEQLLQIASTVPNRQTFLEDLTLDPPNATGAESGTPLLDEDYLILSTIHSAKGQEWKAVFVLNIVDGCIPSDMATGSVAEIEEERRLLYVAMTRAKDQLHLVQPLRFFVRQQRRNGDSHIYAPRSRFITAPMTALFDCSAWASGRSSRATAPGASEHRVDIAARLRDRWR